MTAPFSEFRPASGTKDVVYAVFTRAVLKSLGIEHAGFSLSLARSLSLSSAAVFTRALARLAVSGPRA